MSSEVMNTANKIKTYIKGNCLAFFENFCPTTVNINMPLTDLRSSIGEKKFEIKKLGSPFCGMESDDWLSNTNREYT